MAAKAKLISGVVEVALRKDEKDRNEDDSDLVNKMTAFKNILVHDMDETQFADFYAQTIVYGMFIARINDKEPDKFTRLRASELIPKGYPFLKEIFGIIAISNLHKDVKWIVDDLAELFRATDMEKVLKDYGKTTGRKDPVVHFYEDFLEIYNPKIRDDFGVWLTPMPVVKYIVNATDELLKKVFGIEKGLADNSMVGDEHRVQILDPATGTGTFQAETVEKIKEAYKGNMGMWPEDVKNHIVPRLFGFEYLMAPYTMAHLKISSALELDKLGENVPKRLNTYLTNSLDKYDEIQSNAFAEQISLEAKQANSIKEEGKVMVVMGNPPYKEKSSNNSDWIMRMMDDYKQEPGMHQIVKRSKKTGKVTLINTLKGEKNPKGIDNDYCKFIRLGQMFVDRNNAGILAYITANTYLDTKLFRGMRYNLLQSFDTIYILNLHGSTKRKESTDEVKDECVFDIEQGVAIAIFVKKSPHHTKDQLAQVWYKDVYGRRKEKLQFLSEHTLDNSGFTEITPLSPYYIMRPRNNSLAEEYYSGFGLAELMKKNVQGFKSDHDNFAIQFNENQVRKIGNEFIDESYSDDELRSKYGIKDSRDWKLDKSRERLRTKADWKDDITQVCYRPFDLRWTVFNKCLVTYPRPYLSDYVLNHENVVLALAQQGNVRGDAEWNLCYISSKPIDINVVPRGGAYLFPLWIYDKGNVYPNLYQPIVDKIASATGLEYCDRKKKDERVSFEEEEKKFYPIDVMDYIYAIINSHTYRRTYHDFLQTDFPVIPYPSSGKVFKGMAYYGAALRAIHTLQATDLNIEATFPIMGSNIVTLRHFEETSEGIGRIWINDSQYFDNVPTKAWKNEIAAYQVLDKWLELRQKAKYKLSNEDIALFEKIIAAQSASIEIQSKIG